MVLPHGTSRQLQPSSSGSTPHDRVTRLQTGSSRPPPLDRPRQSAFRYPAVAPNRPTAHDIPHASRRSSMRRFAVAQLAGSARSQSHTPPPALKSPQRPRRRLTFLQRGFLGGFRTPAAHPRGIARQRPASENLHNNGLCTGKVAGLSSNQSSRAPRSSRASQFYSIRIFDLMLDDICRNRKVRFYGNSISSIFLH